MQPTGSCVWCSSCPAVFEAPMAFWQCPEAASGRCVRGGCVWLFAGGTRRPIAKDCADCGWEDCGFGAHGFALPSQEDKGANAK
eukprot:4144851-Alexandrium_andersonii.AAC.1